MRPQPLVRTGLLGAHTYQACSLRHSRHQPRPPLGRWSGGFLDLCRDSLGTGYSDVHRYMADMGTDLAPAPIPWGRPDLLDHPLYMRTDWLRPGRCTRRLASCWVQRWS